MTKPDFLALNKRQAEAGDTIFANPRNSAAGSLRQKDPSITASRTLHFFAYAWGEMSAMPAKAQSGMIGWLGKIGFKTNPLWRRCSSVEELLAFHQKEIGTQRAKLDYDIDGVVYKGRPARLAGAAGLRLTHAALGDCAYKFAAEKADDGGQSVSTSRSVAPARRRRLRGFLEPVTVGGVVVSECDCCTTPTRSPASMRESAIR